MMTIWCLFCSICGVIIVCGLIGLFIGLFRKWSTGLLAGGLICLLIMIFGQDTWLMFIPRSVATILSWISPFIGIYLIYKMFTSWRWFFGTLAAGAVLIVVSVIIL